MSGRANAPPSGVLVWDDRFRSYDFGAGHPFSEAPRHLAVELVRAASDARGPVGVPVRAPVDPAPREALLAFHTRELLERVERASISGDRRLLDQGDTPSFPGCFEAAARIAGGTLEALQAIERAEARRAFQPGGGLHHASRDSASGFCIFNDVALAIQSTLDRHGPGSRVAYLDIDAHHGDGVMYGFYDDGRLLDIDFHQDGRTLFPGTGAVGETGRGDGAGQKVNVPLPPGAGDAELISLTHAIVPEMLREFRPKLIVVQHGVDGHAGDRLAGLRYTARGYAEVRRVIFDTATELGAGVLMTGGGGYHPGHVATVLAQAGLDIVARPAPRGDLPPAWRRRFVDEIGEEAPTRWPEVDPETSWSRPNPAAERLKASLQDALGRRFGG